MKKSIVENLNFSQAEAVLCIEKPLIIFAGAGTGKTRVITHKIAYLLSLGISPCSILAVTFTNKAAIEMKKRVIDLVPKTGSNVWISTFHSFCSYFLRTEALKIGVPSDFSIYNFADQKCVLKDCFKELNIDENKFVVSNIADRISRAKDDLRSPVNMTTKFNTENTLFANTVAEIYELYQKKMKNAGSLDFGDLIMQTVLAFQMYPILLDYYQGKYKYIMVDEYQDTNYAQYVLVKLLAAKYHNICVCGDDDQSIYSWRGADVNNILSFEKDYPNSRSIKLEQNYRSTPKILSVAYQVVKHNTARVDKRLWTQNCDDGCVKVLRTRNENDEALKIAKLIYLDVYSGKYNFSDFAIFYRTNAQSRVFEDAFRRICIPYTLIGTLKFYDRAEIKDIVAYLKFIHNQNDNVSFKRIINVPRRGVGKTSLEKLEKFSLMKNISMWQTIIFAREAGLTEKVIVALNSFVKFIRVSIELKNNASVREVVEKVIAHSGYVQELEIENLHESKIKIENIQELISAVKDFEKTSLDKSLMGYLTQVSLISDIDSADESKNKVTLMTLHLAKGLEFNNVFICGLEEGLFPIIRETTICNKRELEEERRLMYVGMTRAKKRLYLCWSLERTIYGKTKWSAPSRFILEAGFKDEIMYIKQNFSMNLNRKFSAINMGTGFNKKFPSATEVKYNIFDDYHHSYIALNDKTKDELVSTTGASIVKILCKFKIGAMVTHPIFGRGKIIEKSGIGNDLKLTVLFEDGQWKKLLARVANLTLI
ncbi:MAG: UvrD-helicase domain-containing protein [Endomicrobium sp.]|jgi:DNA helicase-2/ATP-dependent DNA helicase PcrA|nr:UvrD-helicase domain-containing protein [Endomicrobium sp.]